MRYPCLNLNVFVSLGQTILVTFIAISLYGCGSDSDSPATPGSDNGINIDSDAPGRVWDQSTYNFVGNINLQTGRCSGTLLRHGLFITAKHCFPDQSQEPSSFNNYSIFFSFSGVNNSDDGLRITGSDIDTVVFDGPNTDIAYVLYPASLTEGNEDIGSFPLEYLQNGFDDQEQPVTLIGFPSQTGTTKRLYSTNCKYTGRQEEMPRFADQINYDGVLYDTDCFAWYGSSGGPAYLLDDDNDIVQLLGVVSHSFDITASGDLDSSKNSSDDFGAHVTSTNFSPLSEADRIEEMIEFISQ